ncbi:xaa-Pro dipeptidase isoform X2 [Daktulosphaira vitifoliae]|uniref:xaa-Pro dipeptidase isoform X2 n=1 Tax=Daktulosphaira vitifoliae TaxID=58002 RepID=UPI0021A9D36F|nr:xaa-Pro dipeptidase isoform X2 [Daktulosphaira vitifoliae]
MTCMSLNGNFSMGEHTLSIPRELYKLNQERLCKSLNSISELLNSDCYVLLQGGNAISHYSSDTDYDFRQESYFQWTFGVSEPDSYGLLQVSTGKVHLFFSRIPEEHYVWMGIPLELNEYKQRYQADYVYYTDKLAETLELLKPSVLLTLTGVNSDSGLTVKEAHFDGIENRVIKTEYEKEVMRYATKVSCNAHKSVMSKCKPGMFEYQCEANFLHYVYYVGGCRHVGYNNICCSGLSNAILHYGHATEPNAKKICDGDLCLFDMGASYCGYTADVTVTFPANGKFSDDQRSIYNIVLAANQTVMKSIKPGICWIEMHILANKVMLKGLLDINLLQGDVDEMYDAGLAAVFQPHGLGHLLGLDVHDVGGYLEGCPERPLQPGVKALRMARKLKAGMAITIEPGCYFIKPVLKSALENPNLAKYINQEVLERFKVVGGVRIEDNVFVTENGVENYTPVPRTIEEIENWMSKNEMYK